MVDKDIIRIPKNNETEIVVRVDDFGGKRGVTIREFVKSERYTGFTKAGTRIPADKFADFKAAINAIEEAELAQPAETKSTPRPIGGQSSLDSGSGSGLSSVKKFTPAPKKEEKKPKNADEDFGMEETEF